MPRLRGPRDFEPGDLVVNSYNARVSVHRPTDSNHINTRVCDLRPKDVATVLVVGQPAEWQPFCLLLAPEGIGYVLRDLLRRVETT